VAVAVEVPAVVDAVAAGVVAMAIKAPGTRALGVVREGSKAGEEEVPAATTVPRRPLVGIRLPLVTAMETETDSAPVHPLPLAAMGEAS